MTTKLFARVAFALSVACAGPAAALDSNVNAASATRMAAHFIDVGQGAAVLLEFSCGAALVDAGGQADRSVDGNARLMAYLETFFQRRPDLNRTLDVAFLTHAHADHTNGAWMSYKWDEDPNVPKTPGLVGKAPVSFEIRNVVSNAETKGTGIDSQDKLHAYAARTGAGRLKVSRDNIPQPFGLQAAEANAIRCPGTSPVFRLLWGSSKTGQHWEDDGNNQSLAIRLDFGGSSFLFLGDMEDTGQPHFLQQWKDNPAALDVDVFHAPHHGSKNGTTEGLLRAQSPEIAVISAGDPSKRERGFTAFDFGHPNIRAVNLMANPSFGVTTTRAPKVVAVGLNGRSPDGSVRPKYTTTTVRKGIYATGWDGDVVIEASADGTKTVKLQNN